MLQMVEVKLLFHITVCSSGSIFSENLNRDPNFDKHSHELSRGLGKLRSGVNVAYSAQTSTFPVFGFLRQGSGRMIRVSIQRALFQL